MAEAYPDKNHEPVEAPGKDGVKNDFRSGFPLEKSYSPITMSGRSLTVSQRTSPR